MGKFFKAVWRKLTTFINDIFEDTAVAVEKGNTKRAVINISVCVGGFILFAAFGYSLLALAIIYRGFLFTWVGIPAIVILVISYLLADKKDKPEEVDEAAADEVEVRLICEYAGEIYEDLRNLLFNAMQSAAANTPLARPNDEYEIETSAARGNHFYLDGRIVVFQFEGDVQPPIDRSKINLVQQELQRRVNQHVRRYPILISDEAKGRAPVEVLDIKNAGGHVLIEIVITSSNSIPLIEARRRARIEYQVKQERVQDPDFS